MRLLRIRAKSQASPAWAPPSTILFAADPKVCSSPTPSRRQPMRRKPRQPVGSSIRISAGSLLVSEKWERMSPAQAAIEIEYPETDGKPRGETDVHRMWMIRIYDLLKYRYRGQNVYIGSDLLLYYTEGNPAEYLVPDDFVVLDCDPGPRRTFQVWKEQRVPNVVFEVTSRW